MINSKCKWFSICPMRWWEKKGKVDSQWRDKYCLGENSQCVRYIKEEAGIPHSDKLLPDGTYLN